MLYVEQLCFIGIFDHDIFRQSYAKSGPENYNLVQFKTFIEKKFIFKAKDDYSNNNKKNNEASQCGSVCYLKHNKHNNTQSTSPLTSKSGKIVSNNNNNNNNHPEFNIDLNDTSIDEILLIADDSGTFNNGKLVNKQQQQQLSSMSSPLQHTTNSNRLSKLQTPFPTPTPPPPPNPPMTHSPSILVNARLVYLNNNENEKSKESFSIDSLQRQQQQQPEQMQMSSVQQNIDRIRERINLITNSRNAVNSTSTPTMATTMIQKNPNQLLDKQRENAMVTSSFELMHTPQPDFIDDENNDAQDQKSNRGIILIIYHYSLSGGGVYLLKS
jgi:hypothetical protein